jgi:aspartyl-tRNA(Asn)/glutamyl-tRNA(Gln) amidotransferase subunit B
MVRIPTVALRNYLLRGKISSPSCLRIVGRNVRAATGTQRRALHTERPAADNTVPFRKQQKDEAKKRKAAGIPSSSKSSSASKERLQKWELTVGIEIHAQLNTAKKLFSSAASTVNDEPNTHVALFDVAMPGSMPIFQAGTLIPALRAALALNCEIMPTSRFDRKHYFHWDQPSGYQITQYYEPFAKGGYITLYKHDGIAKEDGDEIKIGIKQVQMEQDTAKTIAQPGNLHLLDFNRVGLPLIEIITGPEIHHPATAAALVRKVQILLNAVDACVLGMQSGGLRADVNVSVRRRGEEGPGNAYAGVKGLGQRTEIKNLSSFKAVEDAIIAERDRQIDVLENGGVIEGETRGWTLGSTQTRRLRGKEGEVDYRYMPDPDLPPVILGDNLVRHLRDNMGILPDEELSVLTKEYNLTMKDAMSLVSLNDGYRAEYFYDVIDALVLRSPTDADNAGKKWGKVVGNWVLHELGGLVSDSETTTELYSPNGRCIIPANKMADIVHFLSVGKITGRSAKKLLAALFEGSEETRDVEELIEENGYWLNPLSEQEYEELAKSLCESEGRVVDEILKGREGKIMYLVGQMMRRGEEGRVEPKEAERIVRKVIDGFRQTA